jgi:hypothetical protein
MVDLGTGVITTVVGSGNSGFSGDGGPATDAALNQGVFFVDTLFVSVGLRGELYITDPGNFRIRVADVGGNIATFAGKGVQGFCGDGGPALDACFDVPGSTAVDPTTGDLYVSDKMNRRVRRVSASTGFIDTVIGTGTKGPCEGGAGAALATCICPSAINIDAVGRVYISDSSLCSNVIFRFDPADGNVTTLVGRGLPYGWCTASSAADVCLDGPFGVAFTAAGNLLLADAFNALIREVVMGGPALCPPGCLCPCATPEPCTNATEGFCPGGAAPARYPVTSGYYAVAESGAGGFGGFVQQRPCPVGAYCSAGVVFLCPTGTYGVAGAQKAATGCALCPAGTYNPEVGRVGVSACLPCPAGAASEQGAAFCAWCPPSSAAASGAASCSPCRPGTYALFGAAVCAPLPKASSAFEATAFGAAVHYPPPFSYSADSALGIQAIVVSSVAAAGFIPVILLLLLLNCNLASTRGRSALRERVSTIVRSIDSFSEARAIKSGEPRVKRASALGGVLTLAAFGTMAAIASALIIQYARGNFIVLSSSLPASTTALAGVDALPFRSRERDGPATPPELPVQFTSGLLVRLSAQGSACGDLSSNTNTSGLDGGSWSVSGSSDERSNSHVFDLTCGACTFGALSLIDVSFDGRCQTVTVLVAAVGAQGEVTLYSFAAAGAPKERQYLSELSLSVPPTLDVLLDTAVLHTLTRGLLLVGASSDNPLIVDAAPAAVRVRVSLASGGSLVQTRVDPIVSRAQLFSSITGLAGLLGIFATAFTFADGNRALFRRLVVGCSARCCCCRRSSPSVAGTVSPDDLVQHAVDDASERLPLVSSTHPRHVKASAYAGLHSRMPMGL